VEKNKNWRQNVDPPEPERPRGPVSSASVSTRRLDSNPDKRSPIRHSSLPQRQPGIDVIDQRGGAMLIFENIFANNLDP
jgi:hypothetical protein